MSEKVKIKQVRSASGRTQRVKDTLTSLGLGRIGKEKTHVLNSSLEGKIKKVIHLIEVRPAQ